MTKRIKRQNLEIFSIEFQTNLIPCDQISLFNFESIRTSDVFIIFSANFFNSLTARGARFLNALFSKIQTQISFEIDKKPTLHVIVCVN